MSLTVSSRGGLILIQNFDAVGRLVSRISRSLNFDHRSREDEFEAAGTERRCKGEKVVLRGRRTVVPS